MPDKFYIPHLPEKEWIKGFKGRVVHGENITVVFWEVEAGAVLPTHSHPHEQLTIVLKGSLIIKLNGEELALSDLEGLVIPSNTPHGGAATVQTQVIDVFSPLREDYK
ncbi:MAG TPA: cupin domain-containing protein [Syntrophales bacterium]|nr:cupin domain-containing protein [Syntrophales bacterium]HOL58974.1 cupin domain-containing protein [Syntrophales bacterium]HPO34748.1 cupin domain-containing protein [Syntrophales bacterium]